MFKIKQPEMTPEHLLFTLEAFIVMADVKFTPLIAGIGGVVLGIQPKAHCALFVAGTIALFDVAIEPKMDQRIVVGVKVVTLAANIGATASLIYLLGRMVL